MSHDTFISHSSDDKVIADAVTAALEQANIRCWIAPRDIRPGDSWGGAIVEAIEHSRVMVVIFSAKSNDSKQVMREVERAVQHDVVVVPFRIEDVQPTRDMEYFLSSTHWLDAMTPEIGEHLKELTQTVANILEKPTDEKTAAKASKSAAASMGKLQPVKKSKSGLLTRLVGALSGVLILALAGLYFFGGDDEKANSSTASKSTTASQLSKAQDLKPRKSGDVKLKFSDEVRAGAELEVTWRGKTADNDYIAIVAADAAEGERAGSKTLGGNESLTFSVTDKPGNYEVRFIDAASRKVIARDALEVLTPEVTLEAPKNGMAGSIIKVAWSGPNDNYDQLTIAEPSSLGKELKAGAYISKGSPTDLRLPDRAGNYVLRYVSGSGREVWKEIKIEVEKPEVSFNIADTQMAGSEIQVDWSGPANSSDYISVARPGMENKKYISYAYVRAGSKPKLRMPPEAGKFELRYISGQTAEIWARVSLSTEMPSVSIASPQQTTTGNTLEIEWQGPANRGDYLSIAEPGTEGNIYLSYKYIKKGGKATIEVPQEPGRYIIRYISGAQSKIWFEAPIEVLNRSETITAKPEVKVGEQFKVSWQNKGFGGQYIGVFPKGASDDGSYTSYVYTRNNITAKLAAPKEPGEYELRYISGNKKLVWARASLRVSAEN